MKFFNVDTYDSKPEINRSDYMRNYYLRYRKRSIRKKPIMTEEQKKEAHKAASKRHKEKCRHSTSI